MAIYNKKNIKKDGVLKMIKFDRLWERMKDMGLSKTDLYQVVSAPTVASLVKNEYVKLTTIENICKFLQCTPNDIMEIDMGDMSHASWRTEDKAYDSRFVGKKIVPATKMLEKESETI